jgi:hypothetical protein
MIDLDRLHRSPVTIMNYMDRAERLFLPALGKKLMTDVTPADVEKVVGEVKGPRNKAYTLTLGVQSRSVVTLS